MKLLIKIFTAALLVSLSTQAHSLEKLKLMDVVSEPEGNLKREIYLELDKNRHIRSLEILVDGKLDMKASAEDFEKGEVLITNVRGFDSVFLNCIRCDTDKARLELRYLQNRATGKFITKTIEIKRMGALWAAIEKESGSKIDVLKFTSNQFLGILVGVDKVLVNP